MEASTTGKDPGPIPDFSVPMFEEEEAIAASSIEGGEQGNAPGPSAGTLNREQFFEMFRGIIAAPNILLSVKGQKQLETLKIGGDNEAALAASNAIYDTCQEFSYLRWMIEPGNAYMQRAVVVGTFVVPLALAARAEYMANNARPVKTPDSHTPTEPKSEPAQSTGGVAPNPPELSG